MASKTKTVLTAITRMVILLGIALGSFQCTLAPAYAQQPDSVPAPVPATSGVYRLASGDAIVIQFFYNPEFDIKATIRPDGKISMPLHGEIEVVGLSIEELTARLTELYKGTIRVPAITIQVENFANRRIFVGGEVSRPGMFPLTGHETLLSAIYEAGGLTKTARRSLVTVIRRSEKGVPEYIPVSLKGMGPAKDSGGPTAAFALQPLDVVVVHESGVSKANRAIDQYVRQMIPMLLTGGFTYLLNGAVFTP